MKEFKEISNDTAFKEVTKPYHLFVNDAKGLIAIPNSYHTQWSAREVSIYGEHIHLYSKDNLELINFIESLEYPVNDIAFHPGLPFLLVATGNYDGGAYYEGNLFCWNYEENKITKLINDNREFTKCKFLENGRMIAIEVSPADDLYENELKIETYEFDFDVNTSYDLMNISLVATKPFENVFNLEAAKSKYKNIIDTIAKISIDSGKVFNNRNLIWDTKFLNDYIVVIARNESTIETINLDTGENREFILPKKGDCVEVFRLTSNKDLILVNLWSREWDSEYTTSLYEINLNTEHIEHKGDFNHSLSKSYNDFFLARQIDHSSKNREDYVLNKSFDKVLSKRFGHYDLFNHYLRIDNSSLLYFLVGSPKNQHQNKCLFSINPVTLKTQKVFQIEEQPSHYNNLSGIKSEDKIIMSGSIYRSNRNSYGKIELFAIDMASQKEIWFRTLSSNVASFSDLGDDKLAIALANGAIELISTQNGETIDKAYLKIKNADLKPLSIDCRNNRLVIGTTDGRIFTNEIR